MAEFKEAPGRRRRRGHGLLSQLAHLSLRALGPLRWGRFTAATPIEVAQVSLSFARLPEAFEGYRIALVADLHYGRLVDATFVRRVAELVLEQGPDLVLFGGDFVDRAAPRNCHLADLLKDVLGRFACYAVPGNHDYYGRPEPLWRNLRQAGLDILVNEHRLIGGTGAGSPVGAPVPPRIALAGLDDARPDFRAALEGIVPGTFTILAGHSPDLADLAPPHPPVDLMLAGHTHGGQIRLWGRAVVTQTRNRRYVSGLVQGPGFPMYISRGLGATGLALRVGAPSELPILTLRACADG